jgi:hypothetical protein
MSVNDATSDIIVVHQNRIIFSSGDGLLTQHSKISAQVTQVLNLFSQRIMGGEQIHFIRFENHRMIFLSSQYMKNELVAIILIPIEKSARQVIPAMSIILRQVEKFLQGNILDAQNRHLDIFYQILSAPNKSLIVTPRTPDGILATLVILSAFAHDLRFGIQEIVSNLLLVDPNDPQEIGSINQKVLDKKAITFLSFPEVEENDNILLFGLETPLRQYFSAFPGEKIYDVIARVFGDQSNAAKMRRFIANEDAREIAQSISLLPHSEDEFIRNEVLLSTVLRPGKDVIVTLSTPLMERLQVLTTSIPTEETPETLVEDLEIEDLTLKLQEEIPEKPPITYPKPDIKTTVELAADPDAIPEVVKEEIPEVIQVVIPTPAKIIPRTPAITHDVAALIEEKRKTGFLYQFESIPLVFDTSPFEVNLPDSQNLPYEEGKIAISLFTAGENHFAVRVYTAHNRLPALKDSLEDLSVRFGGESHLREDHVLLEGPFERIHMTLRAVLWLCIVEYLTQVQMKIQPLSDQFVIPKEGSILIIPPRRDYIKEKIPSKFKEFVEEARVRKENEQESLWTLGMTQDVILSQIMKPLKRGDGVVFVATQENQEMEEIALFLLLVSEVCGIGFSRW